MPVEVDHNRKGLVKLMLKFPTLRGQLQVLSLRNAEFLNLCGAFDEASSMLDRLRRERGENNRNTIAEYEEICLGIEQDILRIFAK